MSKLMSAHIGLYCPALLLYVRLLLAFMEGEFPLSRFV
jgi:hypothetical protein